jgi:hypothetical protein
MPTAAKAESAAQQARFVFIGTVQKLRAATLDEAPVDDRTAIVRVDEVIDAPEALAQYAGHDITVHAGGRKRLEKGQQAKFYANPWLFGDSIAVESLDHEDVKRTAARETKEPGDPVRQLAERDRQARFGAADLVVSGRVSSVRVPKDEMATRSARARGAPTPVGRISEHEPDWRVADIKVDEVHKGTIQGDTVSVRFPDSQDVLWHDAPKFHPGQEGFFMLHRPDGAMKLKASRAGAPIEDSGDYVAPQAADFQPFSEPGGVRHVIDASAETTPRPEAGGDVPPRKPMATRARSARRKRSTKRRR